MPSVSGAYILCEGLYRNDNATLSRYDAASVAVVNDIVPLLNPNLRLGDTANNMVLRGDTLYIAVSVSRTIEIFRASTGVWIGRIRFAGTRQEPRHISIVNDSTAFVSLLNDDSIQEWNPKNFTLKGVPILVGPSPEGIAASEKYVFVANSGFGDIRAQEAKAGTISVIERASGREFALLGNVPNVRNLILSTDKTRLYAAYTHLYSAKDSLGGIVEYDAVNLKELRRWRTKEPFAPRLRNDSLLCLSAKGVELVRLGEPSAQLQTLYSSNASNIWYALALHPSNGEVWVGNARNNQVAGEVLIFHVQNKNLRRFEVGLNPNTIVFY
ncbi:MAG: hypothetical protein EAZ92_12425 [Candidatus Kapaibacterium sp.]|nr:MAG: hypothetical protein EAZ92_12425 [Candidatus Kapabacteria bacterium]